MLNLILLLLTKSSLILAMSEECSSEWAKIYESTTNQTLPKAYSQMYQYSGFILNDLGNYDQCNDISIARYAVAVFNRRTPLLVQTFCGPISCSKSDYHEMVSQTAQGASFEIIFPHVYQNDNYREYDGKSIFMIIFVVSLASLAILAGIADYLLEGEQRTTTFAKYLLCFSLLSNSKSLLVSRSLQKLGKKDTLEILDAIRVLSLMWIVFGHTQTVLINWGPIANFEHLFQEYKKLFYTLDYGFVYAVDAFFWLSGFLMAYFFIAELERSKDYPLSNFITVYLHRYLRITPVYMFVIFFFMCLQDYLGRGPLYFDVGRIMNDCENYWYTNLFYINNFVPDYKGNYCLDVSWYLPVDMQFFVISPIVLYLYVKVQRGIGWVMIFLVCLIGCLSGGLIADHYDLNAATMGMSSGDYENFYDYLYVKPYTRGAPYVLGLASAFIVYSYKKFKETNTVYDEFAVFLGKILENIVGRIVCFTLGLGLINAVLLTLYSIFKHPGPNNRYEDWDQTANSMFFAFDRLAYGLGLTLVFVPLLLGHFSWISDLLSGFIWNFISRIAFCMYLIHISIIQTAYLSSSTSYMLGIYRQISNAVFFFILALVCALPFALLVEMPALNVEKLLLAPGKRVPEKPVESKSKDLEPLLRAPQADN